MPSLPAGNLRGFLESEHCNPNCPLNPRQLLHLGGTQDRTGSPNLGDFEEKLEAVATGTHFLRSP
ncbi:hypothetical protein [Microcoleus sp. FACHB-68]|uniref:hypothetical protein n=1 Tax=Microcoleus sp. FACHB-68 TaxID=2692826 RepID=UPI00168335C9|nr:hypothetical protein [Microcoleus sp. FACHB-68]MBD1937975.1 hypothetical protein [Microcoleus sp. FACHB-68]